LQVKSFPSVTLFDRELKGELIGIIDANGVPDEILNSPIGSYDGDVRSLINFH